MANKDRRKLENCISAGAKEIFSGFTCEYPLDQEVIDQLKILFSSIREEDNDFEIFKHREKTDFLWRLLIEKSIKCLRCYDMREPFQAQDGKKAPKAYGIEEMVEYYNRYTEFERILYGSNQYYRDHVIHVFRTWLSGVELLTKNDAVFLDKININEKNFDLKLNNVEKLSIWTLIALTHDLGYPLQKAKSIIDTTRSMLTTFITNPDISIDFSFHGVQNYMNDFILRLMSSKMKYRTEDEKGNKLYVARLQPKYYFKFQKSLEKSAHGVLSTLIIYKLLTYFLESDYSINEDYTFDNEECRQFYIRREILRAIAAHTCNDVYQLYMVSFSFLLRICDDTQEWGRKSIADLYISPKREYKVEDIDLAIDANEKEHTCTIKQEVSLSDDHASIARLIESFREQALVYVTIFRDGQDTISRDFSFRREFKINYNEISIVLLLKIEKDSASTLSGTINYISDRKINAPFGKDFFGSIKCIDKSEVLLLYDAAGNKADQNDAATWRKGSFNIQLV